MAWWRVLAVLGVSLAALAGCSGKSSSNDDDGGGAGESGASNGGSSGKGGSGGSGAKGGTGGSTTGGTSGKGGTTSGGSSGLGGSSGTMMTAGDCGLLASAEARRITLANLGGTLREGVSAVGFVEGSELIGRVLALGDAPGNLRFVSDSNDGIDDWMDELETKVLADGNVEVEGENYVTYLMTGAVYCAPDPDDVAFDPQWAAEMQQDCADDLAQHPLRVTVTRVSCGDAPSVSIEPELGNDRIKPVTIVANQHGISARLDVAETVRYVREQGDGTDFDTDSSGVVSMALATGSGDSTLTVELESPLIFGSTDNGEHSRVRVDGVSFQATAQTGDQVASANIQTSTISVTGSFRALIEGVFQRQVAESVPGSYGVTLEIPGVTGTCRYERDALSCTDVGFGDAATVVGNEDGQLLTADLNPGANRRLDLELSVDSVGDVRIAPSPSATLELGYNLQAVADKLENIQQFALDDVVTFAFTGNAPSALLLVNDEGDLAVTRRTSGTEVMIESGTFEMSSEWSGQNVTVEAGQCLSYSPNSAVAHEILRGYGGLACGL